MAGISDVRLLLSMVGDDPEALSLIMMLGELFVRRKRERRSRRQIKNVQSD